MKNLLLFLAMFVVGCSFEKDTKLVCICDYVIKDSKKETCPSIDYRFYESSLVINESKKKFWLRQISLDFYDMEFNEDNISLFRETEDAKFYTNFDRNNLVLEETRISKYGKRKKSTFYFCVLPEEV